MKTITKKQLKEMLDKKEDITLINVLSKESFEKEHIPKSINIPLIGEFEKQISEKFPDKNKKIIIYCASFQCPVSTKAAEKLEQRGYKNVYDYKGGMADWKEK